MLWEPAMPSSLDAESPVVSTRPPRLLGVSSSGIQMSEQAGVIAELRREGLGGTGDAQGAVLVAILIELFTLR